MESFLAVVIVLFIFIGIPIIWGIACKSIAQKKGRSGGGWFCCGFFLGVIGLIILLCLGDVNAPKVSTVIQQSWTPAEEVQKLKELCDEGIITQEEFERKKKQLLGL